METLPAVKKNHDVTIQLSAYAVLTEKMQGVEA